MHYGGANGVLDTASVGDDTVIGTSINTGNDGVCQTTKQGDDVQVIQNGKGLSNVVCVTPGVNAFRDTKDPAGNDDTIVGDNITTGPDGICNTAANGTDVNSTDLTDAEISEYLKKVYSQAVCEWQIARLPAKSINFDLNRDGKFAMGGTRMSSLEMQAIKDGGKDDSKDANVFLVDNISSAGVIGKMGFAQRYGFVSPGTSPAATNTLAHELGHGMWSLRHPDQATPVDNDIENLMHSSEPTPWRLRKNQWDIINP